MQMTYFGFLQTESSVARYQEFLSPKLKSFRLAKVHILVQISDKIIQNQHVKENMLVDIWMWWPGMVTSCKSNTSNRGQERLVEWS